MSQSIPRSLGFILCLAIVGGCSPAQPRVSKEQEHLFREIIAVREMNKMLRISIQSGDEAMPEFGDNISVVINNLSDDDIFLPGSYGIRMFVIRANSWLEIQNGDQYYGEDFVLHPKGQDGFTGHVKTWIRPVLPSELKGEKNLQVLRIVAIGEWTSKDDKTGVPVAAYADVFVSP